jgi:hypothetical protein
VQVQLGQAARVVQRVVHGVEQRRQIAQLRTTVNVALRKDVAARRDFDPRNSWTSCTKVASCKMMIVLSDEKISPSRSYLCPSATSVASRDTITFLLARRTLTLEEFKYAYESWRQTPAIAGCEFLQLFNCNV